MTVKKTKQELLQNKKQKLEKELQKIESEISNIEKNKIKSLEERFQQTLNSAQKEIDEQISVVEKEVEKLEKLSEEYGIPFRSYTYKSDNLKTYFPYSFNYKWVELNEVSSDTIKNSLNDLGIYNPYHYGGWEEESWNSSSFNC